MEFHWRSAVWSFVLAMFLTASALCGLPKPDGPTPSAIVSIKHLNGNQAVTIRGTVTAFSGWKNSFFLQDETGGISVDRLEQTPVQAGDRVEVAGTLQPGRFAPLVLSTSVAVLAKGATMPQPLTAHYDQLVTGRFDSAWVAVEGVIHSAKVEIVWDHPVLLANLYVPGGSISVHILNYSGINVESLVDSSVTVRGVCGTKFNDRRQLIGVRLFVPSVSDLTIASPAPDSARIQKSDISQVQQYSQGDGGLHRVRMTGTLTYQNREHGLYLEDKGAAIHLQTEQLDKFRLGERLEAWGFLHTSGYSPGLQDARVRSVGVDAELSPVAVEAADVITKKDGFSTTSYDGRLILVSGTVVEQIANSQSQVWLLRQGDRVFQAELANAGSSDQPGFEAGSVVNITGICVVEIDDDGFPASFRVLLRKPADITVARSPSSKPAVLFALATLVLLLGGGIALWYFERISGPGTENQLGPERTRELLERFQLASKILPRFVIVLVVLSFAVLPHPNLILGDLVGSMPTRVALALAALAVLWGDSGNKWKDRCSLSCIFSIPAIGCYPLWQGSTESLAGALSLCLFGISVPLWRHGKSSKLAQLLFVAIATVSMFNIVTRIYGATPLFGVARDSFLPLWLAVCLLLLSGAALFSRPDQGLMKTIASPGLGGLVSRRLLPAALVPIFIGWLRLQGQLAGLYDTLWGLTLFAMSNVFAFGCIIWTSAAVLNRLDLARSKVAAALKERDNRLELLFEKSGIGDYTWDILADTVRFHPIVRRLYGAEGTVETCSGEWFRSRQHPDDAAQLAQALQNSIQNRRPVDVEFRVILPDGGIRWLGCLGTVLYDANGVATHINGLNLDITSRKRSEAAVRKGMEVMREADQQMQNSLELAKVPVWRWIRSSNAIRWSGPVQLVLGKSAAELSHLAQYFEIVHPDDLAGLESKMSKSLASSSEFQAQFRILVDGKERWIAGRGDVLRDNSGEVSGLGGVNFDITSTKLAEQRLMDSERSFRELADAIPQMVWISNAAGDTEYLNRQWADYTGSSKVRDRHKYIHPDDLEKVIVLWQSAREAEESFEYEMRLKRSRDNSYRWHLTRVVPVYDTRGQILRWFGTSTDIEDFKQSQLQVELLNADLERRVSERSADLAESEVRYRLLVEEVKDYAILLLDPQGLVKTWNKGAEQLTGYKSAEILGKHFSTFYTVSGVSEGQPDRFLMAAIAEEQSKQEGWRKRQDGSEFWASAVITSLWDSKNQLRGFSKIIRDMTEQRRVEGLLSKRAESATEAKTAFLASVSHEIRTPMNAILGMADMLWESDLNQSQRHYVEIFRRAGGSLLTLINDILDLSKIESGSFCLEEVDFDLTTLIEQVIEILMPKAESKGVGLRAQLGFIAAPAVVGDPVRLQQVLLNLIGNAIKFTGSGEVVLRVKCDIADDYATLEFEVRDTGIGIPSNKLETIFDDFVQAETSTTRRFGGTGLGLGISRRLVRRMRGEIHVESELGKGSTFSFNLILPVGAKQAPLERTHLEDIGGRSVLIVDHNPVDRVILSEMCSAWGMVVTSCASGAEAVELVRAGAAGAGEQPWVLALVDRMMPGMDGFETAEQMRKLDPKLAIFIVSSDSRAGDVARCRELGLSCHLMKPVRRAELLEQVVKVLSQQAATSAPSRPAPTAAGNTPQMVTRRFRLLAAEDSEDNRFLLHVYCEGSSYELTFVEDGERAVAAYEADAYDLIVMDIQMPVMDGLTATRRIRSIESEGKSKRIPILALTANALPEDVKRAREAGCDAHLSKPISKKNFLAGLEQWLAKSASAAVTPLVVRLEIPEGLEQLAPRYLAARQQELPVLQEMLARSDFENLRRLSHNLKGTGTSYGFPDISRLGAAMEQASKDCNIADLSQQLASLSACVQAVSEQLRLLEPVDSGQ